MTETIYSWHLFTYPIIYFYLFNSIELFISLIISTNPL